MTQQHASNLSEPKQAVRHWAGEFCMLKHLLHLHKRSTIICPNDIKYAGDFNLKECKFTLRLKGWMLVNCFNVFNADRGCIYLINNRVKSVILSNMITVSFNCFLL